jgi:hypothetical protein
MEGEPVVSRKEDRLGEAEPLRDRKVATGKWSGPASGAGKKTGSAQPCPEA